MRDRRRPPPHIVALAWVALAPPPWPPAGSPSEAREVIADWLEDIGDTAHAGYLRPRPLGVDEEVHARLRQDTLREIWSSGSIADRRACGQKQ